MEHGEPRARQGERVTGPDDRAGLLRSYLLRQLGSLFPRLDGSETTIPIEAVEHALRRADLCTAADRANAGGAFDHLVSGHYATFLYRLSHRLARMEKDEATATRLFLLNKALNGIDLFHGIDMPELFLIGHTVGMTFAKAEYGERLVFHQGCTVGRSGEDRPRLGCDIVMYPHSSVIGRCVIGDNSVIAPGVQVINRDIPGDCYVFAGGSRELVFRPLSERYTDRYFRS